jgi:hypothetical protein
MSWVAAAVAGGAIINGVVQSNAASKGAKASQNATNAAIAQQNMNYDRTAENLNPYINAGTSSLGDINKLNSGDYSGFQNSPDYQFNLQQGIQGVDRSAAARGSLYSGGHSADLLNYASGLASNQLNNYRGALMNMAQMGQGAASNLGSIGAGQAGAIGGYLTGNAANQAAGYQNQANAYSNTLGQLAGAYGQYQGQQMPTASSYVGTNSFGNTGTAANGWGAGGGSYSLAGGPQASPYFKGA